MARAHGVVVASRRPRATGGSWPPWLVESDGRDSEASVRRHPTLRIRKRLETILPTIVQSGAIELKVYPADKKHHQSPHFHVWIGGESVASVRLSDLQPFIGGPLSRAVRQLIDESVEELWDAWEIWNV